MFETLKKKLSSWLGKEEKKGKAKKKEKKLVKTQKKSKKAAKKTKDSVKKLKEKEQIFPEQEDSQILQEQIEETTPSQLEAKGEEKIEEKQGFFSKLKNKLLSSTLTQESFNEIYTDFEIDLLENNVALEVSDKIKESLSKDLVGKSFKKSDIENKILESLKNSISSILVEPPDLIKQIKKAEKPFKILFFGINGSGKTTSIAKLASLLKSKGFSCVLAAADTFRAASIEQLEKHAVKLNVPIIKHDYGADPAAVAFDAINHAKKNHIDIILIDTAGRMYTKSNLIKEMEKIVRITQPNLKIFVGESITGNDAVEQAKTFNEAIGIDGIILTKADVDDKAGAILSVSYVTNKPIYFLGTGQGPGDLQTFKKSDVLKHLGL